MHNWIESQTYNVTLHTELGEKGSINAAWTALDNIPPLNPIFLKHCSANLSRTKKQKCLGQSLNFPLKKQHANQNYSDFFHTAIEER